VLGPGTLIDRYELVYPIGEGGMAHVWVARQHGKHGFAKLFALKAIHSRFADDPHFRAMFLDEARIVSAIENPHVAQVFDLGEDGSMLYLVMEYVDGESLAQVLQSIIKRASGADAIVPTGVALRVIADVCAGLHAAHRLTDDTGLLRGIVHRDVSPQNILLATKGDVKLIDFGIALAKDRAAGDTSHGSLKGKLHYMAPEQARQEKVGPYTDVFAAGATLYRMLAGRPAYHGDSEAGTMALLVSGAAPPPLPASVPPLVAAIVTRALEADPGDRYDTALGMQRALEAAIVEERLVSDVAGWVKQNLSDRYRERKEQLAKKTSSPPSSPPAVPDLVVPGPAAPYAKTAVADEKPEPIKPKPKPEEALALDVAPRAGRARALPGEIVSFTAALTEPEPEPPPPSSGNGPGFIDVQALAAKRGKPIAAVSKPPLGPMPKSQPDAALASPAPKREAKSEESEVAKKSSSWIKVAIAVVLFVVLVSAGLFLLPMIVRDRIIASAREAGVELSFDGIGVGFSGVSLKNVKARIVSIPGVELRADEIFASGTSAANVRVSGAELKVDGAVQDVGMRLVDFYTRDHPRFAGTPAEPRHVSVGGARLAWTNPFGEGTRIDASDVGAELDSKGTDDIRAGLGRFEIKTKRTVLGPWMASFEQSPGAGARARLILDPAVPDGPSVLYVFGKEVTPKLTVRIARSPLAQLGIRADDLALPATPTTELEAKIEGGLAPSGRIEATAKIDLWAARVKLWKSPVDIHVEGSASGLPGKPLELDKTTASIGPFVAHVTGTITPDNDGVRFDAAWRTTPIQCGAIARAEAKTMGTFVSTLQELAQKTGAARVTGTAQATGIVKYDTKTPDDASFTVTAKESCGISLFGL
jgi:serine/threonine protein kinase